MITSACTGWQPNQALYAVANQIEGPWQMIGNPCIGENADKTFGGQSTFVLQRIDQPNEFVFMADCWKPNNLKDSRYIWLPIVFTAPDRIEIRFV